MNDYWRCVRVLASVGVATLVLAVLVQADGPRIKPRIPQRDRALPKKSESGVRYKFVPGQSFAYRFEMTTQHGEEYDRFTGTPFITVQLSDGNDKTELLAIGKLAYAKKSDGTDFNEMGMNDMWIGSRILIDSTAHALHGKKDYNLKAMPSLMSELINIKRMLFPELPKAILDQSAREYSEGTASLFTTGSSGFLPTMKATKGVKKSLSEAYAPVNNACKFSTEYSFRTTEGDPMDWKYESTGSFDVQLGLMTETKATYIHTVHGRKEFVTTISIKLLKGDDERKARIKTAQDRLELPTELNPVEFKRIRLTMPRLPTHFKKMTELKVGQDVAHWNNNDHFWCRARVIEILNARNLRIRYDGSKEEFEVVPGNLAPVPGKE